MCAICCCGTVNSCAVSALFCEEVNDVMLDSDSPGPELQPQNDTSAALTKNARKRLRICVHNFMADSSYPPPDVAVPSPTCSSPAPDDMPVGSPGKSVPHRENPAGSR